MALLGGQAWAGCPAPFIGPAPTASNSVTFGDAIVYSLPLLEAQSGGTFTGVQSSPGQINDCIVVGSGAGGQVVDNALPGLADNAYENVQGSQNPYFRTGDSTLPNNTDPGGANQFLGDTDHTWDIRVGALNTYLKGGALTFLFNHNQTGSGTGGIDEDLFVWAQVALRNIRTGVATYFYVSARANNTGLTNFGLPGGDPTTFSGPQTDATNIYPSGPDGTFLHGGLCSANNGADGLPLCDASYMIRARGRVCLNSSDVPVPCDGSGGAVARTINDNLGATEVANAVIFPELNALLASINADDYTLQIDWRMGCNAATITGGVCPAGSVLNNGYEQLFIVGGPEVPTVAEPETIGLLGLGLLGLFAVGRRRRA
jgi:MYXO-CTERM domain-containing protein